MLDEEGRTRLKLKVCSPPCVYDACRYMWWPILLWRERPEFILSLLQVENTIRWRAKKDEEGNETRESNARIVKWSDGRCVCYVELGVELCTYRAFKKKCLSLATACPSTWGTRCLMFTKLLSRETTTTCSSDRALGCRDRLCSKPNSHSGNAGTRHCCIGDRLLLRPPDAEAKTMSCQGYSTSVWLSDSRTCTK